MATVRLAAVSRHIQGLAADSKRGEQSDGALLHAYLRRSDQAAFETLLLRHAPMVLGVCRRALGNAHDAEDALQATFLVLAQKAASIRKRESLVSWLHGVAYRMATHAKRAAVRRHHHESRVNPPQPPDPALQASWQELQALFDEEIAGLPETLRSPFILCCLESKSYAESAHQLGIEEGTIRNRLGRARKRLQERLSRRGLALTTLLAATAVGASRASTGVPRSLLSAIVHAAAQLGAGQTLVGSTVSSKVLALVEGVKRTMFVNKCKTALLLLVGMLIVGAGLGMAVVRGAAVPEASGEGSKEGRRQPPAAPTEVDARMNARVHGRVLDPDGKPIAGAKLYLGPPGPREAWSLGRGRSDEVKRPVRATSGNDGRFTFTLTKIEQDALREHYRLYKQIVVYQVMAVAPGHGCEWASTGSADEEVTVRLVKDVPIRGRILDPDGKPVAGARLTVIGVFVPRDDNLDGYLEWFRKGGQRGFQFARSWVGPPGGAPAVLTTGADGRFRLAGVGRERMVYFRVEGPAIATKVVEVMTRAAETVVATRDEFAPTPRVRIEQRRVHVYGATFDYVAAASRPIRGVVRDKETGQPLSGVRISAMTGSEWAQAVTDTKGSYELAGLPKSPSFRVTLRPADGHHFDREEVLDDTPGFEPLKGDFEMMGGGVTVRGKVADKDGKPVAQVHIEYYPLHPNKYVSSRLSGIGARIHSAALTGPDGSYVLTVLPGPGVIGVRSPKPDAFMPAFVSREELKKFFKTPLIHQSSTRLAPGEEEQFLVMALAPNFQPQAFAQADYHALVLLEPGAEEKALQRNVRLEPPQELKGRVLGPDGQPLAGATVKGLSHRHYIDILKGAEFTVRGLNPRSRRQLLFRHKDKDLGCYVKELPVRESETLTVKLQPCGTATGRIVNEDGEPVAGILLRFNTVGFGYDRHGDAEATTDKQGRFHVKGLVAGIDYQLTPVRGPLSAIVAHVSVEPGRNKDVGDVKLPMLLGR